MRRVLALGLALLLAMTMSVAAAGAHGRGDARSSGRVERSRGHGQEHQSGRVEQSHGQGQEHQSARGEHRQGRGQESQSARVERRGERGGESAHERWRPPNRSDWRWVPDRPALRRGPRVTLSLGVVIHSGYGGWIVQPEDWWFVQAGGFWYAQHPGWGVEVVPSAWFGVQNEFVLYCANDDPATRELAVSIITGNGGTILWSDTGDFGLEYVITLGGYGPGLLPVGVPLPVVLGRFTEHHDVFVAVAPLTPDMGYYGHYYGPYYGHRYGHMR